ncbi:MAG TPA: hypothetical protein VKU84_07860 [Stellaceae bacterium]|nr:hypothetical protein [Stellaceae bacterium]
MGTRGPKPHYSGKGAALSARISLDTRERLDKAARRARHSLSEEVEARLASSLDQEALEPTERALLEMIGRAITAADKWTGKTWLADPWTFHLMRRTVSLFIDSFMPEGPVTVPDTIEPYRELRGPALKLKAKFLADFEKAGFRAVEAIADAMARGLIAALEQAAAGNADPRLDSYRRAATRLEGLVTAPVLRQPEGAASGHVKSSARNSRGGKRK